MKGTNEHYDCINCERDGSNSVSHSAHWYKCPAYMEPQNKGKQLMPYYNRKQQLVIYSSLMSWWSTNNLQKKTCKCYFDCMHISSTGNLLQHFL